MANNFPLYSLSLICFVVLILSSNLGESMADDQQVPFEIMKTWCVAKPSTSNEELNNNINYVCVELGMGCDIIQEGGPCYSPNNLFNHASVVMNLYYQNRGQTSTDCDFQASGLMVISDPSYGDCFYSYSTD